MQAGKRIPDSILGIMRTSVEQKVKQLLKEAFTLAAFIENPQILEQVWEELAQQFFNEDDVPFEFDETLPAPESDKLVEDEVSDSEDLTFIDTLRKTGDQLSPGANLVTGRKLKITATRKPTGKRDYAAGAQHKLTASGTPTSHFRGLSWCHGLKSWRVRYQGKDIKRFEDETEAARYYDRVRFTHTRSLSMLNFPEDYQQYVQS